MPFGLYRFPAFACFTSSSGFLNNDNLLLFCQFLTQFNPSFYFYIEFIMNHLSSQASNLCDCTLTFVRTTRSTFVQRTHHGPTNLPRNHQCLWMIDWWFMICTVLEDVFRHSWGENNCPCSEAFGGQTPPTDWQHRVILTKSHLHW